MKILEVIALTGLSGAGKGKVAEIFRDNYSFSILSMDALVQRRLAPSSEVRADKLTRMRGAIELGSKQLSAITVHELAQEIARTNESKRIIIDSLFLRRQHEVVSSLLPFNYNYMLVGVYSPEVTRFRRMNPDIGDVTASSAFVTFLKNDLYELGHAEYLGRGLDVKYLLKKSDIIIENNASETVDTLADSITQVYAHMRRNRSRVEN